MPVVASGGSARRARCWRQRRLGRPHSTSPSSSAVGRPEKVVADPHEIDVAASEQKDERQRLAGTRVSEQRQPMEGAPVVVALAVEWNRLEAATGRAVASGRKATVDVAAAAAAVRVEQRYARCRSSAAAVQAAAAG